MSTPNPETVREIAQDALRVAIAHRRDVSVGTAIYDRYDMPMLSQDSFRAWHEAVGAEYDRLAAALSWPDEQPQDDGALSAAYRERAHLVALLATWYPSHIGYTDPNAPDWAVVTVELATGQACWHIAPSDMDLFGHVQQTDRAMRGWDGHSTEEKYRRIDTLAAQIAGASDVVMSMRTEQPQDERDALPTGPLCRAKVMHDGTRHYCALNTAPHKVHQCGDCGHVWIDGDEDLEAVLAERDGEISRLRRLLGIGVDRDQWDAIAYAEGARFEHEQTDDNLVGYLAYRYEDMKAQRHILLREIEEAEAAQDERDGDVRAVAALWAAQVAGGHGWSETDALIARFASRIEALEARDAKAGE